MSRISYFQRYSQRENHATNNTLLLFRHFYQASPFKLEAALATLLDADFSIGLTFEQQVKGPHSVPDALIRQEPFRLFIETKRFGALDKTQIESHILGMSAQKDASRGDILLGLTKEPIATQEAKELADFAKLKGVLFSAITFSQIVDAFNSQCEEHERELKAMIEDYKDYLQQENLLEDRDRWLAIFPCGTSLTENVRFGVYYEPPDRSLKRRRFIGLYAKKLVGYIGEIQAISVADLSGDEPVFHDEVGSLTNEQRARIIEAVGSTHYYDLAKTPHRFYVVDSFLPTRIHKQTDGGVRGHRDLDLEKLITDHATSHRLSVADLAKRLTDQVFD